MATVLHEIEVERNELNWLLNSGALGRSHNLTQMLKFICEKHFQGESDQITEHSVAVEALGRRSDFDPQTDTIVRVTAHTLRKRLQEIYQGDGASRPVHIVIPPGQYAPSFVHANGAILASPQSAAARVGNGAFVTSAARPQASGRSWLIPVLVLAAVVAVSAVYFLWIHPRPHNAASPHLAGNAVVAGHPVRALLGEGRQSYVDHSGFTWSPGHYCTGGASVAEPAQEIAGTEDPYIYQGGVRGNTHCLFPVDPGIYEVRLLFAELSHLETATSRVVVFLNGSDGNTIDIVDDATGDNIATTKVFSGVRPQNDGAIHVDFLSDTSLLKAVEILPTPTEAPLSVRIVAGPRAYTDPQGNLWLSDRYFVGGRLGLQPKPGVAPPPSLYSHHRVGHFRYDIPVVPLQKYRVRLYFQEPWFGKQNGGTGGPNSRIFDVWCNGAAILSNFDILKEAGSAPIVKTFDGIRATAQGKIELEFVPVVNYPLIDAIEVSSEPAS